MAAGQSKGLSEEKQARERESALINDFGTSCIRWLILEHGRKAFNIYIRLHVSHAMVLRTPSWCVPVLW